ETTAFLAGPNKSTSSFAGATSLRRSNCFRSTRWRLLCGRQFNPGPSSRPARSRSSILTRMRFGSLIAGTHGTSFQAHAKTAGPFGPRRSRNHTPRFCRSVSVRPRGRDYADYAAGASVALEPRAWLPVGHLVPRPERAGNVAVFVIPDIRR